MSRRHGLIGASKPWLYKEEDAEFYYRQTSGGVIMNNSPLVGSIDRIKGQTIAWNQLCKTTKVAAKILAKDETDTTLDTYKVIANLSASSTRCLSFSADNKSVPSNHKVLLVLIFKSNFTNTPYFRYVNGDGNNVGNIGDNTYTKGAWNTYTRISDGITLDDPSGFIVQTGYIEGEYISLPKNGGFQVYDLTLIYGKGNEPTTPEQFEADYLRWFGKPLTYEPYDAGSLRNVQMEGIKSVWFNQWDEEWEVGRIKNTTGQTEASNNNIRSKNYISILPNTTYCEANLALQKSNIYFYDANKNYIEYKNPNLTNNFTTFVTPANAAYMKFFAATAYGHTYNNDICINISDTTKNGTYKPYKSETRNFDVTTLTGKLNGEGESVVIFPDGMKGVNDVKDEIYIEDGVTKAVKRIGRVDLGSLTSYYLNELFTLFPPNMKPSTDYGSRRTGFLSSKYMPDSQISISSDAMTDKTALRNTNSGLYIKDTSYTDAATFKTAMSGVYLDYELAEPQVYVLDTPLPIAYNCEAGGTEQILPEEIGTGIAPIMDIKYKAGNVAEKPWYGIKWSEDNGQMQRIASNMELHATLPIQSNMKRCMLLDNGSVYKYISDAEPFLYEDGTSVKYDGTDGQVMVEVPAYWYTAYKETDENNITWNYLKLYPEGGGQRYSRKIYRGAFEMITDNSDNNVAKGCSVSMLDFTSMGTTKDTTSFVASNMEYLSAATSYRNWNYANVDATDVKNSLGKPTTNRNRATFRGIAARRGAGFSQEYWDSYNSLIRLYVVEYCNFNIQANINNSLTVEGFKQGGLGAGVTNANSTKWSNFNGYNPFVPCGVTVPLGNKSGAVSYAFTNDDFDDVSITYSVPSYRGIENPFGHIWKFIDGLNRKGKVENDVTTEMIYVCDTVSKFAENDADGYVLQSDTTPRASGSFGGVDWDAKGTFWPKLGGRTMYSDYFYNAYANNIWYTLLGGGSANYGSKAGLFYLNATSGSGATYAAIGSRLLYTK